MCLTVGYKSEDNLTKDKVVNRMIHIATKDIPCYKLVFKEKRWSRCTPYTYTKIRRRVLKGRKSMEANGLMLHVVQTLKENMFWIHGEYVSYIEENMIYTFANLKDTMSFTNYSEKYEVYKCIIPKGTWYAKGMANGKESYASREIKFIEKI